MFQYDNYANPPLVATKEVKPQQRGNDPLGLISVTILKYILNVKGLLVRVIISLTNDEEITLLFYIGLTMNVLQYGN